MWYKLRTENATSLLSILACWAVGDMHSLYFNLDKFYSLNKNKVLTRLNLESLYGLIHLVYS